MATKANTVKKTAAAKKAPAKKLAKKTIAKKAAKKTPAKKKAVKRATLDLKPIKTKLNRAGLAEWLVENSGTDLSAKQAREVLANLQLAVKASLMPKGCGEVQIPGLVTIKIKKVAAKKMPAIKKGTLVRRPGQSEPVEHPGRKAFIKPATVKVRARALGGLKRAALGTE
jgi:hypothetical protein